MTTLKPGPCVTLPSILPSNVYHSLVKKPWGKIQNEERQTSRDLWRKAVDADVSTASAAIDAWRQRGVAVTSA